MSLTLYRPLKFRRRQSTFLLFTAGVIAMAARVYIGSNPLLVTGIFLASFFALAPLSNWWARRQGGELVTGPENFRRYYLEVANEPISASAGAFALLVGQTILTLLLLIAPIEEWPTVLPLAVGAGLVIGALLGIYAAVSARRAANVITARDAAGESAQPVPTMSFGEMAARHYFGYVVGLAVALPASTVFEPPTAGIAFGSLLLARKIVANQILPGPVVLAPPQLTGIGVLGWLRIFLFGIAWWGVPAGIAIVVGMRIAGPEMPITALVTMFGIAVLTSGIMFIIMAIAVRLSTWTPGSKTS